jgi:DNA-binding CsgD family transcriptional regulator
MICREHGAVDGDASRAYRRDAAARVNDTRQERLLGLIYDAPFDPALWVTVMEELAADLAGEAACMTTLDILTGQGGGVTALVPDGTMDAYLTHWAQANPLHEVGDPAAYVRHWRPATIRYEDWIDRATLHRSPFFNEFLRPIGSENGIMMGLALVGAATITLNIARPLRRDVFADEELARARRWHGHLSRAVRLERAVRLNQAALDAIDRLVEGTSQRLFFLDGHGRVRRMTAAAEAMVAAGGPIRLVDGAIGATRPDEERQLRRLIAAAADPAAAPSGGAMRLRDRDGGEAGTLTVTPLGPRSVAAWTTEPIILVAIADSAGPALPFELRLRERFALSPAETRVALALLEGGTLREIAEAAGVSINTVRAQIAAIFGKTGCNRQVDLLRLLLAFQRGGE